MRIVNVEINARHVVITSLDIAAFAIFRCFWRCDYDLTIPTVADGMGNEMGCDERHHWWQMVCKEFGVGNSYFRVSKLCHSLDIKRVVKVECKDEESPLDWVELSLSGMHFHGKALTMEFGRISPTVSRFFVAKGNEPWKPIERDLKNVWAGWK